MAAAQRALPARAALHQPGQRLVPPEAAQATRRSDRGSGFPRILAAQRSVRYRIKRADRFMRLNKGPYGVMTKTWPTGVMMVWVAVLLVGYLMLYYVQ